MADRKLEVKLISAQDLPKVNKSKMHVYVVAWVDPIVRVHGPVDRSNGCNPVWDKLDNSTITVALEPRSLSGSPKLNIELVGQGFLSTKPVGYVVVDLAPLLQEGASGAAASAKFLTHQVTLPSGELQGTISFEVHLQECPAMLAAQESTGQEAVVQETAPETPTAHEELTNPEEITRAKPA